MASGTAGLRSGGRCATSGLIALLLSGCSSFPSSMNPVTWWHDLQGGKIAEERPPPPGADQPYPNLASVPPKPTEPDRAALANVASALVADRTNAQHLAAGAPLADPSSPSASPALFGKGTVPPPPPPAPPGTPTAKASLQAAEAPPPAPAPASPPSPASANKPEVTPAPAKAPVGAVQSAPLAPPGATAQPAAEAGAPPAMPATPPRPPNLPGIAAAGPRLPAAAAPAPAAVPPPAPAPTAMAAATPAQPPPSNPANTISVTFVNGSAALPSTAADTLKQLASRRGNGVIAVTGYGDASSNEPDAQSAALTLALSRAQAMANALTAAGVPATAVQIDAEAIGRGGTARLVQ
jgi:outer membrane protein OmpA-like peptidoglycan-associated protein